MNISKNEGSHLPVLIKVMSITKGDVLEMGTGIYSTPFLHWTCYMQERRLVSYENIEHYFNLARLYRSSNHKIMFTDDWDKVDIEHPWEVAFIDHGPAERREVDVKRLVNYAKYIIIHDSQPEAEKYYHYSKIYPLFKYRYDYTKTRVTTSVLSNFVDVRGLNI